MSNEKIEGFLETSRKRLVTNEVSSLEIELAELTKRCRESFSDEHRDDAIQLIHIRLVDEALQLGNIQLCQLALKKLNVHKIDLLFDLNLPFEELVQLISNYFQLESPAKDMRLERNVSPDAVKIHDASVTHQPVVRSQLHPNIPKSAHQLEHALENEIEENFAEALSLYELSGTRHANFLRISMKHLMCESFDVSEKYCLDNWELRPSWIDYLLECKLYKDAMAFCASTGDGVSKSAIGLIGRKSCDMSDEQFSEISVYASVEELKWSNLRQLDGIVAMRSGDMDTKARLADIANLHLKYDDYNRYMTMAFILNRADSALDLYLTRFADQPINSSIVSKQQAAYLNNNQLVQSLKNGSCYNILPGQDLIKSVCCQLGLLDDLLQLIAILYDADDPIMSRLVEHLEGIIESGTPEKLDAIDPKLTKQTVLLALHLVEREGDKNLNSNLVTVILLAINVYLMKLAPSNPDDTSNDPSISELETMFEFLSKLSEETMLHASDKLVRITNNFVAAIKSKLEAIADSEIIRDNFIKVVDKIAGLCLIDSRYKSAAILYSQIEDNVGAIKALMRTGEADTVMNYALLVRDITVFRITINYIRHLKLQPEVIEDFIARSKL